MTSNEGRFQSHTAMLTFYKFDRRLQLWFVTFNFFYFDSTIHRSR